MFKKQHHNPTTQNGYSAGHERLRLLWNISRNDVTEEPTRLADSYANYKKLAGRGIRAEFYVNEPSPVYPERFLIIPGVDKATSNKIYNDLQTLKHLDEILPPDQFLRTHKSYIVGIAHVSALDGNELVLGPHKIPISRDKRAEVVSRVFGGG